MEVITTSLAEVDAVDLHYAPSDAQKEISPWLAAGWSCSPQSDGDLGAKLNNAFAQAFEKGRERVIIIGSDCPYLATADIDEADEALKSADVVLGPATDGGYWLVGLSKPAPEIFENINWSTETVLDETQAKAKSAHLTVQLLRELSDVDDVTDLMRFHEWSLGRGIPAN